MQMSEIFHFLFCFLRYLEICFFLQTKKKNINKENSETSSVDDENIFA